MGYLCSAKQNKTFISASIHEKTTKNSKISYGRRNGIETSDTVAVAVGLKSSATAVDLRPSVQHCIFEALYLLKLGQNFKP